MTPVLTKSELAALKGYVEATDHKSRSIARQIGCIHSEKNLDYYIEDYINGNYRVKSDWTF